MNREFYKNEDCKEIETIDVACQTDDSFILTRNKLFSGVTDRLRTSIFQFAPNVPSLATKETYEDRQRRMQFHDKKETEMEAREKEEKEKNELVRIKESEKQHKKEKPRRYCEMDPREISAIETVNEDDVFNIKNLNKIELFPNKEFERRSPSLNVPHHAKREKDNVELIRRLMDSNNTQNRSRRLMGDNWKVDSLNRQKESTAGYYLDKTANKLTENKMAALNSNNENRTRHPEQGSKLSEKPQPSSKTQPSDFEIIFGDARANFDFVHSKWHSPRLHWLYNLEDRPAEEGREVEETSHRTSSRPKLPFRKKFHGRHRYPEKEITSDLVSSRCFYDKSLSHLFN